MDDIWGDDPDWFHEGDKDDDADEEVDEEGYKAVSAQHCLVLLDCNATMFESSEGQQVPIDWAMATCEKLVRSKVRTVVTQKTGKRDGFGMVLYNTRYRTPAEKSEKHNEHETKDEDGDEKLEDDDEDDWGHAGPVASTVHEFIPLEPPGVKTIRTLQSVQNIEDRGRRLDLQVEYMSDKSSQSVVNPLQLALQNAMAIFRKNAKKDDQKQIWIFTNVDNPTHDNPDWLPLIETTAKDVQEMGADIIVWPLSSNFDAAVFYEKVQAMETVEGDLQELMLEMQQQWKKIRPAYALRLLLPGWQDRSEHIMVNCYRLIQTNKLPQKVQIHQETGRMLTRVRQMVSAGGGGEILAEYRPGKAKPPAQGRLRTYVEFAGEKVPFSLHDKAELKRLSNANPDFASLIVIGFKPKNSIPFWHTLEQAYFVYPNEDSVSGSAEAFAFLHDSMLRKGVVAICEQLTRVSATSRLVAMWPLKEEVQNVELDDRILSTMVRPPGMVIVTLPFEDEVRVLDDDAAVKCFKEEGNNIASEELVEAAIELVKRQSLADVEIGENFENSTLVKFWDYVEHVALSEELQEDREFDTIVDEEEVLKVAREQIDRFLNCLPEDLQVVKASRKRKVEPDTSGIDWNTIYHTGSWNECKVQDLKAKLRSIGDKVSGKKDELVDRVRGHLAQEFSSKIKKEEQH